MSAAMTPTERQRARELADAASPGPWKLGMYRGFGGRDVGEHDIRGPGGRELAGVRAMFYRRADAEFTAEARALVPRLLAALEAAERERDALGGAIRDAAAYSLACDLTPEESALEVRRVLRRALGWMTGEPNTSNSSNSSTERAESAALAEDRADFFASTEDHG